jgi:hypothetical protein
VIKLLYKVDESGRRSPRHAQRNKRFYELETVFAFCWHGLELPDDDAGRDHLFIAACHLWHLGKRHGADSAIREWAQRWARWCGEQELADLIERVAANPRKWTADELAHELGVAVLPFVVRQALNLTTIGSIDVDKEGRERLRGEKSKDRSTGYRRANGQVSRAEYLAANSKSRDQPWVSLNMSKSKYYRLGLHEVPATRPTPNGLCETGPNAAKEEGILVRSDLSHDEFAVDQSRAQKAPRRLPDAILYGDSIFDGGLAWARRLTKSLHIPTTGAQ